MKISWGVKIILSFVIFAAGIITMVVVSMSSSTDLVSENYYEQEIKYQDQIDILTNSKELDDNTLIEFDGQNIILKVTETDSEELKKMNGEIYFYRTSDARKDFKTNFAPGDDGVQLIHAVDLEKGSWKVKLSLNKNSEKYFVEKTIFIN